MTTSSAERGRDLDFARNYKCLSAVCAVRPFELVGIQGASVFMSVLMSGLFLDSSSGREG